MDNNILNREKWLTEFNNMAQADIFSPAGYTMPPVRLSVGYPTASDNSKTLGACHSRSSASDGINQIYISPTVETALGAANVVLHEMGHAVDDCGLISKTGDHGKAFGDFAAAIGLLKPLTATTLGAEVTKKCEAIIEVLGEFPHVKLESAKKKQKCRQILVECAACALKVRMSKKYIEKLDDTSHCPCCDGVNTLVIEQKD